MDNSFLNLAHFNSRRADNHLRNRRFDEAIECHQKVADYLDEATKSTTSLIAIESLQLQKTYHLKQKELVKIKKLQYEKYKIVIDQQINLKNLNNTNRNNAQQQQKDPALGKSKTENSCQLQLDIYKTMEEADSLLEILSRKGSDTDSLKSLESDIDDIKISNKEDHLPGTSSSSLSKKSNNPKDDSVVIEELRSLNHQLHIMVFQLVTQLDESIQEADALRDKVTELEKEKVKFFNTQQIKLEKKFSGGGESSSNDTVTSHHDLSPEAVEAHEEFPALAPLELPNFDYESLSSKSIEGSLYK